VLRPNYGGTPKELQQAVLGVGLVVVSTEAHKALGCS
jgi:hypothetical protein